MNHKNRSPHYQTGLQIIILVIVTVSVLLFIILSLPNSNWPPPSTPTAPRNIINSTLPLHEKWRSPAPSTSEEFFDSNGEVLAFIARGANGTQRLLNVLDGKGGSLLWKTEPIYFSVDSGVIDRQRLYLASSFKILAYDLATGKLLWESQEALPDRTEYKMYTTGDNLIVYSAEDPATGRTRRVIRIYDSQSGTLKSTEEETFSEDASFLLHTDSIDYWTSRDFIRAVNHQTREEQWRITLDERVWQQPILFGNEFIFASGIFSDVIAVNKNTGSQIWKYDKKTVSNLAVDSESVYAIREDAAIVAINVYTGRETGHINISPEFTEERGSRSIPFLITAARDMVFVYYGDSQEIIAFSK